MQNWYVFRCSRSNKQSFVYNCLEGRRESFYFFNYLIALQRHWCSLIHMILLKRLRAHCFSQQVRRFSNISRNNTTGCCCINYCPCGSSYIESLKLFSITQHTQASVPQPTQVVSICFEEKDASIFGAKRRQVSCSNQISKSRGLVVDSYILVCLDILEFGCMEPWNYCPNVKYWTEH